MSLCIDHNKTGNLSKEGYARIDYKGKRVRLHRLVYCQNNSCSLEDIKDFFVLHSCDNPRCVNPDHLKLGTHQDNMRDKVFRKRTHNRKLKDQDAVKIREESAVFGTSAKELAKRYGVSYLSILRILQYKTYYELP